MLNNWLSDVIRSTLILMSYYSNETANKLKTINVEHVKLFMFHFAFFAEQKYLFSHKQELNLLSFSN